MSEATEELQGAFLATGRAAVAGLLEPQAQRQGELGHAGRESACPARYPCRTASRARRATSATHYNLQGLVTSGLKPNYRNNADANDGLRGPVSAAPVPGVVYVCGLTPVKFNFRLRLQKISPA